MHMARFLNVGINVIRKKCNCNCKKTQQNSVIVVSDAHFCVFSSVRICSQDLKMAVTAKVPSASSILNSLRGPL